MTRPASARARMVQKHLSSSSTSSATASSSGAESKSASPSKEDLVVFESDGHLKTARLNRPKALNSLNKDMVDLLAPKLRQWEESPEVHLVVLEGTGRAFCAGGDVVSLINHITSPKVEERSRAVGFFKAEYELDSFIAKMSTPVVCLLDGISMGGGLGLSMHTPFRVATENTRIAMPETTIGLFPDVGAGFFLSRLDGEVGTYLGLTSESIFGWGAVASGFATHFVPSSSLPALKERLSALASDISHDKINEALLEFAADPQEATTSSNPYTLVGPRREAIDHCFGKNTVEEIVQELQAVENGELFAGKALEDWARNTRQTIEQRSPTSCKVTLIALRESKKLNIDEVFLMDMRLAATCCDPDVHPDFRTGVTHLMIQKAKGRAGWQPSRMPEVDLGDVHARFFSQRLPPSTQVLPLHFAPTRISPYREYPDNFGLPRENEVARLVTGEAKGSGSFALTRQEVISLAERRWSGRAGLRSHIEDILDRMTQMRGGNDAAKTLQWR